MEPIYARSFITHYVYVLNHIMLYESSGRMLELIDELILLVTHLKYYDGPNCDLIKKYKDLLVIIIGSDNKIK